MLHQTRVILLLFLVVACSAVTTLSIALNGNAPDAFEEIINTYNSIQSDVVITFEYIPPSSYYSQIKGSLALGDISYQAVSLGQVGLLDLLLADVTSTANTDEWKLQPLTSFVDSSDVISWDDIALFTRSVGTSFNQDIYLIPFDGDFHYFYWRDDVFEAYGVDVPLTLEELIEAGRFLMEETTMVADAGMPDVAFCITNSGAEQMYRFIIDFALPYVQYAGTDQGGWFSSEDMTALMNNAGFKRAVELFADANKYGYGEGVTISLAESREAYGNGTCAMTIDWGDILFLSSQSTVEGVANHTKSALVPGSTQVYDRDSKTLKDCTVDLCPFATETTGEGALVNRAPFAAHGGWSLAIPVMADHKEEMFAFLEWASSPSVIDPICLKGTGFEPYRQSINDDTLWADAGLADDQEWIMSAIGAIVSHSNVALDLRITGFSDYVDAMESNFVSYLYGSTEIDEMLVNLETDMEAVTDDYGRSTQLLYYRMTLGIDPLTSVTLDGIFILLGFFACSVAAISILLSIFATVVFGYFLRDGNFKLASPNYLIAGNVGWLLSVFGIALFVLSFVWQSTIICVNMLLFIGLGVAIALGSLFAKQARIYWILRATRSHMKRFTVPNDLHLLPLVLVGIPLPVVVVIVWTIIDTFKMTDYKLDDYTTCTVCESSYAMLWAIVVAVCVLLFLTPNGILVFKTRKLPITETKVLSLSIQISAVLGAVIALVYAISSDPFVPPKIVPGVFAVGVILIQAVTFVPKIWKAARRQPLSKRDYHLLTGRGDSSLEGYIKCPHCQMCYSAFGNQVTRDEAIEGGYNPSTATGTAHSKAHSVTSVLSAQRDAMPRDTRGASVTNPPVLPDGTRSNPMASLISAFAPPPEEYPEVAQDIVDAHSNTESSSSSSTEAVALEGSAYSAYSYYSYDSDDRV
ncbi:gamma-aminobutyric acid type B receptor subunit 1-like [Carpediemonas membranifera]|uniref:Gamma-aminobutyric acid type B receptor subunit 1-like n=1 Tax=Carpediemonas membranifera TaxID=201153 RepID=A0A8J6E5Q4_9EUKA|nr:gamma-aminobutyric acid type B receptor subunit 1-like [Carpediemonas membranifera]|eukprot:KAG9396127.1 gamma-aminobutyric acid type B receptor subunit 1-like [Carpediemonas membranifera]